jgi:hypothetical protein
MAETYSTEYTALYITKPAAKVDRVGVPLRMIPFTYTQILAGTAADTMLLAQLPPLSQLLLPSCVFYFAGFTAALTLSIGWQAYTDVDGVVQSASATGLFSASDISNATGMLHGGLQSGPTPDDENPVVTSVMKNFRNATPVTIFATFNAQAPGVNAVLNGYLIYANLG